MAGEWKKNPMVMIIVVVIIALLAFSIIFRSKPNDASDAVRELSKNLRHATGYVCAEESAKLLGDGGGDVVLIISGPGGNAPFEGSEAESYENGFKESVSRFSQVRLAGHFLSGAPSTETLQRDCRLPDLVTFQTAREKYPSATLIVSLIGLPQVNANEDAQWKSAGLPGIIAVHQPPVKPEEIDRLFQLGLVHRAMLMKKGAFTSTEQLTGTPAEIFGRFYEIVSPAGSAR